MATRWLMTSVLRRGLAPLLLACLQLAGCAGGMPQGGSGQAGAAPPPVSRPVAPTEPVADTKGAPPPSAQSTAEEKLTRIVPPKPTPAPRKVEPPLPVESLVGLDQDEATRLVGLPASVVEQPPAIIWHYKNARCALALHFYLEVKQKNYRVLRTKVEATDGSDISAQACLDAIRADN